MTQDPWIYTEEQLEKEAELFKEWMNKPESIFFKQFAVERGYPPQKMTEFAQRSEPFRLVYEMAKHWQEAKVASQSFWGKGNSKIAQLILNVHHDWVEKSAKVTEAPQQSLDNIPPSKDLVNEER